MGLLNKITKKDGTKASAKEAEVKVTKSSVKKEETVKKVSPKKEKKVSYSVLVSPLVSEKAAVAEAKGTYIFIVDKNTNKIEVKKAIEEVYGVKPINVRMINVEGKEVRHGRNTGKRKDWKKAIVTLPAGQSISIHEGV